MGDGSKKWEGRRQPPQGSSHGRTGPAESRQARAHRETPRAREVPTSQFRMQEGMETAQRTVAVLSNAYLTSVFGQEEWQTAHRKDPRGFTRKLLPIRIEDCQRPGVLGGIVSIDLFGHDPEQASGQLLRNVRHALDGRAKPDRAPDFPVQRLHPPADEPTAWVIGRRPGRCTRSPSNAADAPSAPTTPTPSTPRTTSRRRASGPDSATDRRTSGQPWRSDSCYDFLVA